MIRACKLITLGCLLAASYILGSMRIKRYHSQPTPGWEPMRLPVQPWTQEDLESIIER